MHPALQSKKGKLGVKKRENQDTAAIFDPSAISAIISSKDDSEMTICILWVLPALASCGYASQVGLLVIQSLWS